MGQPACVNCKSPMVRRDFKCSKCGEKSFICGKCIIHWKEKTCPCGNKLL